MGFISREYTIALQDGFNRAKRKMEIVIDRTVRRDIGGDHQRIEYRDTLYRDEEYKGILFPIYRADDLGGKGKIIYIL